MNHHLTIEVTLEEIEILKKVFKNGFLNIEIEILPNITKSEEDLARMFLGKCMVNIIQYKLPQ